jgi:hypothetical protein
VKIKLHLVSIHKLASPQEICILPSLLLSDVLTKQPKTHLVQVPGGQRIASRSYMPGIRFEITYEAVFIVITKIMDEGTKELFDINPV